MGLPYLLHLQTMPLNFKIYGSGDPIIILHGYMGSLDNWQTFAKALAEDYMVITVDQRNHGKSFHSDDFSLELLAEDLHELMESEWIHDSDDFCDALSRCG